MMTKLRPSCADSVTATSGSPWPKACVGNHYRAQHVGFVNVSLSNKPCALGRSGFPPTLLATWDQLVMVTESAQFGQNLVVISFFPCIELECI